MSGGPVLQSRVCAAQVSGLPCGVEIPKEEGEIGRVTLVFVGVLHDDVLEVFQGGGGSSGSGVMGRMWLRTLAWREFGC